MPKPTKGAKAGASSESSSGGGSGEPNASFMSAAELAARLTGFREHVWNQLMRLDGTVPPRPVEIPEDLKDIYRCRNNLLREINISRISTGVVPKLLEAMGELANPSP